MSETNQTIDAQFKPFADQMQQAGLEPVVIDTFKYYYGQLVSGNSGLIGEDVIQPVRDLPDAEKLQNYETAGREALSRAVILKLNGGLGTSMGWTKPNLC